MIALFPRMAEEGEGIWGRVATLLAHRAYVAEEWAQAHRGRRVSETGMDASTDWAAMLYRHCAGTWLVVNPKLLRHGSTRLGGVSWRAGGKGSRPAPVRANGCHVAEAPLPSTAPRDAHHVTAMPESSQPAHLGPSPCGIGHAESTRG